MMLVFGWSMTLLVSGFRLEGSFLRNLFRLLMKAFSNILWTCQVAIRSRGIEILTVPPIVTWPMVVLIVKVELLQSFITSVVILDLFQVIWVRSQHTTISLKRRKTELGKFLKSCRKKQAFNLLRLRIL